MKTKRTPLQWAGHMIGATLFLIAAIVPTGIYGYVWWHLPKTFWPIFWTAIAVIIWLPIQVVWALRIATWWDDLHEDILVCPPLVVEEGDGDLDISF